MDISMASLTTSSSLTFSPLLGASEVQLKKLCQVLWGWNLCNGCESGQPCLSAQCPWKRSTKLQPFFQFYQEITSSYVPEMLTVDHHALRKHEDLFEIIKTLKDNPNVPRSALTAEHFSRRGKDCKPHIADQNRAFNLAIRIMTTVCCSIENQISGQFEFGSEPVVWGNDKSFQDFTSLTFPARDHLTLNGNDGLLLRIKKHLTAIRLRKVANLRFCGTDDLKNHLRLDQITGVVEIYHYTSTLKEHLTATREIGYGEASATSTSQEIIPRQLALETLDSIQKILFPLWDIESRDYLRALACSSDFDSDCLLFDSTRCRRENESAISYNYWGARLRKLHAELENPTPRGYQKLWERLSGPRHVMRATVAGIIVAIILGVGGLVVGILQAWFSYKQWKYSASTITSEARRETDY